MKRKNKIIILIGPPGSGKSTWANNYVTNIDCNAIVIGRDGFRKMFKTDYRVDSNSEKLITAVLSKVVKEAIKKHTVILDSTHCTMERIIEMLSEFQGLVTFEYACMDPMSDKELFAINKNREFEKQVPHAVISRMNNDFHKLSIVELDQLIKKYESPKIKPTIPYLPGKPDAIIIDLDGTLAKMTDRGPFDWKRVGEDEVISEIKDLILYRCYSWDCYHDELDEHEHTKPIFMSGRNEICRPETIKWLKGIGFNNPLLIMRGENDYRKDSIVKKELYEKHIKGKYNINIVLDDRNQVVEMWRSLGLKCLQVEEGDF